MPLPGGFRLYHKLRRCSIGQDSFLLLDLTSRIDDAAPEQEGPRPTHDTDVRKIEDRANRMNMHVDIVHHLTVEHTVNQVSDPAAQHEDDGPACCRYLPRS